MTHSLALRRHDLVWLSASGWHDHALRQATDAQAAECMSHWLAHRLPLVVGRQTPGDERLALGLAAPLAWGKRRLSVSVPREGVLYHDRFPAARDIRPLVSARKRSQWMALAEKLEALGAQPRVHGSYGWQRITGLDYVTAQSDIDLHLCVADATVADRVVRVLDRFGDAGPRIDGELLFPCGDAVAWREWEQWRRGAVDRILVKRLHGVALERGLPWLTPRMPAIA